MILTQLKGVVRGHAVSLQDVFAQSFQTAGQKLAADQKQKHPAPISWERMAIPKRWQRAAVRTMDCLAALEVGELDHWWTEGRDTLRPRRGLKVVDTASLVALLEFIRFVVSSKNQEVLRGVWVEVVCRGLSSLWHLLSVELLVEEGNLCRVLARCLGDVTAALVVVDTASTGEAGQDVVMGML